MKKYLFIVILAVFAACENPELIQCNSDLVVTKDSLATTQSMLTDCTADLIACSMKSDTIKTKLAECEFNTTVLDGKITSLNGTVWSLRNELKDLRDYNHIVSTEATNAYLASVQTQIREAEKDLFELNSIVEQDVSEAIKVTTANLNFLKGQRKAIGDLFGIQVQQ